MDKIDRDKQITDAVIQAWINDNSTGSSIDHPWYIMSQYRQKIEATARAEAIREAAERADNYMTSHAADAGFWDVSTLCKIILSDKQEPLQCSVCGRKESAPYAKGDKCYCDGKFLADKQEPPK